MSLDECLAQIRACRICRDSPSGKPLPHEPRPVVRASSTAKIIIAGQAPGARVHASGLPFSDASGDRLRAWLGVTPDQFYDAKQFAIVPMGFCFPGNDAKGGDLPPRAECRNTWHNMLFAALSEPKLIVCIGQYALDYHLVRLGLESYKKLNLTQTVANWRDIFEHSKVPLIPLPHPSWRNSGWLKANPWFETEILPKLRELVAAALQE